MTLNRAEFASCMLIVEAATKPMSHEQAKSYFELLADLPVDAFLVACKRALIESQYPTIPPIGVLRRLAVSAMQGHVVERTADEAWAIAMKAMARCDIEINGSVDRAFADCPPLVWKAVELFGFMAMYNLPDGAIETARAQFRRVYDGLVANEEALRLLPSSVKDAIALIGRKQKVPALPAPVAAIAGAIGTEK